MYEGGKIFILFVPREDRDGTRGVGDTPVVGDSGMRRLGPVGIQSPYIQSCSGSGSMRVIV